MNSNYYARFDCDNIIQLKLYRMAKVFYPLLNDITDRSLRVGLFDILSKQKCIIYTEVAQLKGEKIEVAYIQYNENLLAQIADMPIKKISIFSKGDDNVIIPRNFVKYSSDLMQSLNNTYNVVLHHRSYKTDNEILMVGNDDIHQDVVRNIYLLYGNVITSTLGKYDKTSLDASIQSRNLPNSGGMYYDVYTTLEGLKRCIIKKNIIKVKSNEHYSDLKPIISTLNGNGNTKLVLTNVDVKKINKLRFSIGEHLLAGKYDQLLMMYTNTSVIIHDKVKELRKKLRLEYTYEQIMTIGYLKDTIEYLRCQDEKYIKELMCKNFIVVPIEELGYYMIPSEKAVLTNFQNVNVDIYEKFCQIRLITEI